MWVCDDTADLLLLWLHVDKAPFKEREGERGGGGGSAWDESKVREEQPEQEVMRGNYVQEQKEEKSLQMYRFTDEVEGETAASAALAC